MSVSKKDFAKKYVAAFNDNEDGRFIDYSSALYIIDTMADVLKNIIADTESGDSFTYRGFGTFKRGKMMINTNKQFGGKDVSGKLFPVVKFTACQSLKDMMRINEDEDV